MEIKVLGIGAAGNKATCELVTRGIIAEENVRLINTTTKDIPEEFKNESCIIKFSTFGGCGKEPAKGAKAMAEAITTGKVDLKSMVDVTTQEIVIVTSTEGGTGSGATPVIANEFIKMGYPVHIFAFAGFSEDLRSIKNTLLFFKNMNDKVILHVIKNKEFLDYDMDYQSAEKAANAELCTQIEILRGKTIPSSQNIDDRDMLKLTATPGYMDIKHISLANIKNEDAFNRAIIDAFANSKTFNYDPTAKRVGVIINASDATKLTIDNTFSILKRYTGNPGEFFKHIQYKTDDEEYIDIIASGINIPKEEFQKINKNYAEEKSKVDNKIDTYDSIFGSLDFEDEDDLDMDFEEPNVYTEPVIVSTTTVNRERVSVKEKNPMNEY